MVVKLYTGTTLGVHGLMITVETDTCQSLPGITIVGLPDAAVNEAKERVRAAIRNSGYYFPKKKVVVNLAPADIKKEGTLFDLPIALSILVNDGVVPNFKAASTCFIGELSLNGEVRPVNGVLSIATAARDYGFKQIVVPADNVNEAALVDNIAVYPVQNLEESVKFFVNDDREGYKIDKTQLLKQISTEEDDLDFCHVKGQYQAKRALEIAAAGGHNVIMIGSPGAGKSLLSKCFKTILPHLTYDEAIEITKIYSVTGLLPQEECLITKRPFRSPHHSASAAGIIGGGTNPKPGEVTLAHNGVLFLDELIEFPRNVLEVLRQPMEDGKVTISRSMMSIEYPADFILIASMNPCPCGYRGDPVRECSCSDIHAQRYFNRLSGPLLDRIDIHLYVPRLTDDELLQSSSMAESSHNVQQRVIQARYIQSERFHKEKIYCNRQMSPRLLKKYCLLDEPSKDILKNAAARLNLSARAFDRIIKLARTIADLNSTECIQSVHVTEALQYRMLDKKF